MLAPLPPLLRRERRRPPLLRRRRMPPPLLRRAGGPAFTTTMSLPMPARARVRFAINVQNTTGRKAPVG